MNSYVAAMLKGIERNLEVMAAAMNFQMDTNPGTQKGMGGNMNRWLLVAPRFSGKTILLFTFTYLVMITSFIITAAMPFESATTPDFRLDPKTVWASTQVATRAPSTVPVHFCEVRIPTAPYIIVHPVN